MMHHVRKQFFLAGLCLPFLLAAQNDPKAKLPYELQSNRIVIHPSAMEHPETSTALDMLLLYPYLQLEGFEQMATHYQLRIDGIPINYDNRTILAHIKASHIQAIQIFDHPGVTKGITGTNGVIDIRLKRATQGATGFAEVQGGTDSYFAPTAQLRYGDKQYDLFAFASHYGHEHPLTSLHSKRNLLHGQLTNHLGHHDRLNLIFSYQAKRENYPHAENQMDRYLSQCSYTHTFNEQGTSLYAMVKYQYSQAPERLTDNPTLACESKVTREHMPVGMLTLNLPLPTKGTLLSMGWKCKGTLYRYDWQQQKEEIIGWQSDYNLVSHELFATLQYTLGPFTLGIGDRVMRFHNHLRNKQTNRVSKETHNMFQAILTWTPRPAHQLQGGYYRKFTLPNELKCIQTPWPNFTDESWSVGNEALNVIPLEQAELLYCFTAPQWIANIGVNYSHTNGLLKSCCLSDALISWINSDKEATWEVETSLYHSWRQFTLTASANLYSTNHTSDETGQQTRNTYATFRLTPVLSLPHRFRAEGQFILFTTKTPWRIANENVCAYGALRLTKAFGSHLHLAAEWHDMFQSSRSAALGTISYRF